MDDGFKDRVDKVFGSISSSSSWSLTDAQLERREWRQDNEETQRDDDRIPVFPSSSSLNDDDDLDIRSSIGLDPTLDNEEEEDAYDQMAQGRENGGDRLYMKDVTHHGLYLNAHKVLPTDVKKDPRANHHAAKTRLKEDDDDAAALLQGRHEPMLTAQASQDAIKSILKRRKTYDCEAAKPAKRVRFHSTCKNVDAPLQQSFGLTQPSGNRHSSVPDYILNPSKYTRYTFDDESNSEAYSELLEQINKSSKHDAVEQKSCGELPKSVVFIPRKKRGDAGCNSEEQAKRSSSQACSTVGIAAVEVQQQGEISEMQEDGVYTKARSQKPVRQYRSKTEEYDDVS